MRERRRLGDEEGHTYRSKGTHSVEAHVEVGQTVSSLGREVLEGEEWLLRLNASMYAIDELGRAGRVERGVWRRRAHHDRIRHRRASILWSLNRSRASGQSR